MISLSVVPTIMGGMRRMRRLVLHRDSWAPLSSYNILLRPALAVWLLGATAAPPDLVAQLVARAKAARTPAELTSLAKDAERVGGERERAGDARQAGNAFRVASAAAFRLSAFDRALANADRAARHCRAAGDVPCLSSALNNAGIALARKDDLDAAADRLQQSAQFAAQTGDSEGAAISRMNAANILRSLGRLNDAFAALTEIDRTGVNPDLGAVVLGNKARVEMDLKRYADAAASARRSLALAGQVEPKTRAAELKQNATLTLALAQAHRGDAGAIALIGPIIVEADRSARPEEVHVANRTMVDALLALKRGAEAVPYAKRTLATVDTSDLREAANTFQSAANVYAAAGDFKTAMTLADKAFATSKQAGQPRNASAAATAINRVTAAERQAFAQRTIAQSALKAAEDARALHRVWIGAIVGGALLLGALAIFVSWYRIRQLRARTASILAERARMAADMHDTLLQGLTGLSMQLGAAIREPDGLARARLTEIAEHARDYAEQARNAVWGMRAPLMLEGDLPGLVKSWIGSMRSTTDARIDSDLPDHFPKLDAEQTEGLFRVVQEATTNAIRHASPKTIAISLAQVPDGVSVAIADDGIGFDIDAGSAGLGGHWGMLGMRERVERLRGRLAIESQSGRGTRVIATVPT